MRFSEGRQSHLAHLIINTFRKEALAEIENERLALMEIKRVLAEDHVADDRLDLAVRRKIATLSRNVPPGSREWEILYRQYYEEERRKLKPGGA